MPEAGKISVRQFTVLVILITIGDSILVLAPIVTTYAKQDAWISGLIATAIGLVVVLIFNRVGKLYPQLTLVQSIQKILGKWFGTCIAIVFLIYPLITAVAFTREIGDFMTIEMMSETPIVAIQILFVGIVVLAARLGLEVVARTGELFLPVVLFLFLILVIFLSPQAEFDKLQPILENGIKPILHGSIVFIAFPYMELVVFLMILPYVNKPQKIKKGFIQGICIGGTFLIILILLSIAVLGPDLTSRSMYPSYSLAKRVDVGGFIQRVESMMALMWLLSMFMKTAIYFYLFNLGLAQLLKLKNYRMLTLPMGMLLIVLSPSIAPNITYYNIVVSKYWPYYDLSYGLLLPLLLLTVHAIRKKIKGSTGN